MIDLGNEIGASISLDQCRRVRVIKTFQAGENCHVALEFEGGGFLLGPPLPSMDLANSARLAIQERIENAIQGNTESR